MLSSCWQESQGMEVRPCSPRSVRERAMSAWLEAGAGAAMAKLFAGSMLPAWG